MELEAVTEPEWYRVRVPKGELDLDITLSSGQVFSWSSCDGPEWSDGREWNGIIGERLYSVCRRNTDEIAYQVHLPECKNNSCFNHRHHFTTYFRLHDVCELTRLLDEWSKRDNLFKKKAPVGAGIRVLRLEPMEALISFICSANNNIARITLMIRRLCSALGQFVGSKDGQDYHNFPTVDSLCRDDCESLLYSLGFGYRARYIHKCAQQVQAHGGEAWLQSLSELAYEDAWKQLKELSGVGPKVADCVCLIGLGKLQAVPVDTHIMQVAARDYGLAIPKTLTDKAYTLIGNHFRDLFGDKAGWAQAVLFVSEIQTKKSQKRKAPPSEQSCSKRMRTRVSK